MNPTANRTSPWNVFTVSLELIRALNSVLKQISIHDAALTTQIRRAASSIALNLSEGRRRADRDRLHSWRISAGSAEEVKASLLVAEAWNYVQPSTVEAALVLLDRVSAMLFKMTH